jgi:acetylornithine deacetylase/succinyl-diaminopimelate desuccinylase-like protein
MRSWFANFVLVGALLASGCAQAAPAAQASYRVEAREILARSIAFPTVAGRKQVPAYANYLASVVRSHGVPETDIAIIPHGETVAMLIRIPGKDPKAAPVMFSSHMDVVEARAEDWELDPFVLVESDGHFIGRGVLDNKAGVVAMISAINRIKSEGLRPRHTLVFAFNGDEETTLETAQLIVDHPWVRGAELAINTDSWGGVLGPDGKPLIYMHQGAEKTYASFEITVTNPGGHSSRPRVDNAVYDLADILTRLRGLRFPIMTNEVSLAYLKAMGGVTKGALGEMLRRFVANPADAEAAEAQGPPPE